MYYLYHRHFHVQPLFSWNKDSQTTIVDVAKSSPNIVSLKDLNIDAFLTKFEEWKQSKTPERQHLYAELRDMHQSAGINRASVAFGADEEMLAFGTYVARVKDFQKAATASVAALKPAVIAPVVVSTQILTPAVAPAAQAPVPPVAPIVQTAKPPIAPAVPAPIAVPAPAAPSKPTQRHDPEQKSIINKEFLEKYSDDWNEIVALLNKAKGDERLNLSKHMTTVKDAPDATASVKAVTDLQKYLNSGVWTDNDDKNFGLALDGELGKKTLGALKSIQDEVKDEQNVMEEKKKEVENMLIELNIKDKFVFKIDINGSMYFQDGNINGHMLTMGITKSGYLFLHDIKPGIAKSINANGTWVDETQFVEIGVIKKALQTIISQTVPGAPITPSASAPANPNASTEKLDFTAEKIKVNIILQEVNKPSKLSYISALGKSSYFGESASKIDYAVQRQDGGEYYIYDKPTDNNRNVYRTDSQKNIISIVKVNTMGKITDFKGPLFQPPYMPIIKAIQQ